MSDQDVYMDLLNKKTFKHSGGAGDMIYALPTMKNLGGGILYLRQSNPYNEICKLYDILKPLLEKQSFIHEIREYPPSESIHEVVPDIHIDYDLDSFRKSSLLHQSLMKSYFDAFSLEVDYNVPFLELDEDELIMPKNKDVVDLKVGKPYVLINRTQRYRDSQFDWKPIFETIVGEYKTAIYFVGLKDEYLDFVNNIGFCTWIPTNNMLDVARLIKFSDKLYCNQSVALTIAQAFGHPYMLEVAPNHWNCIMGTPNETLINIKQEAKI